MSKVSQRIDPFNNLIPLYSELLHIKRYSAAAAYAKGKTLDIACGNGYGATLLTKNKSVQYFGIDIDKKTIEHARANFGNLGTFTVCNVRYSLPYEDNIFDTVCSLETIEHLEQEEQSGFYNELLRVLKNGRLLIISTPNRNYKTKIILQKNGWNNPFHKYEFKTQEFKQFLLKSTKRKINFMKSYYFGLPYNISGTIHKHMFSKYFRKLPKKARQIIDIIDLKLGVLFPNYCNSTLFVIKKLG